MHVKRGTGVCALATILIAISAAAARELTLNERLAAQRAIERVYFDHRAWPEDNPAPKPRFEAALTERAIRARVEDYLAQSRALETIWNRPITAAELQAELDRMARGTRDPILLRELFDALGNDPFVIAETLGRQNLADNLARREFAREAGPAASFETWWAAREPSVRAELREPGGSYVLPSIDSVPVIASTVPAARFGQTSVWTGTAMIVWGSESFADTGAIYDPAFDQWTPTSTGAGVPSGRGRHTAVWTGAEMIVWGGLTAGGETNTGARYTPATDSWSATSTGANCPPARQRHTAVWTGSKMIVFGGSAGASFFNTGGLYDPGTDSWTATSTGTGVPTIRDQHTAVWTGTQMIVWGGSDSSVRLNTGSRYTPGTDAWTAITATAPPAARNRHTAVWTGSVMIVWGGFAPPYLNSGARYNPAINAWTATIPTNAPSIRGGHTAVWTGAEMIVWGGQNATVALDNGGRYNPSSNVWIPIASGGGSPSARFGHTALWANGQMLVWGGNSGSSSLDTGAHYEPFSSTWQATATAAPGIRFQPRAAAAPIGASAVFSVTGRGDSPLTYRWRKGGVDMTDGPGISGATTDTLTLTDVQPADAANYSVVATNGSGSATSNDAALTVNAPQAGDLDVGFRAGSGLDSNYVYKAIVQSDGKVIIAGRFSSVNGVARGRIARLNVDGSVDQTFMGGLRGADDFINDAAVQADGKIVIVGWFKSVNGVARGNIARLNADGTLDSTFQNGMSGASSGTVLAIALLPDGKLLVGGNFVGFNGAQNWNGLARLNPDGSLDNTFVHTATSGFWGGEWVESIAVQGDGKLLVGGYFSSVNRDPRICFARLNADGTTDLSFPDLGLNDELYNVVVLPDGRILVGGQFDVIGGELRYGLARVNADGSVDGTFQNGSYGFVRPGELVVQPDGKLLLSGGTITVNGVSRNGVARLNADGSVDETFLNGMSGLSGPGGAVALGVGGQVVVAGGSFTAVNGVPRNRLARLNADGSLDGTFDSPFSRFDGSGTQAVQLPDGRLLMSGTFTTIEGVAAHRTARLQADGNLDASFVSQVDNGAVRRFVRQPDGRILIGGSFTTVAGVARGGVARLNPDGTLDTSFQNGMTGLDGAVTAIALQPDGRVLIGGSFSTVNGIARGQLARLEADGSLDATFQNPLIGMEDFRYVRTLVLQPDGRVLVGGDFIHVGGAFRAFLARFNADGTLDGTFQSLVAYEIGGVIQEMALQPDGRILIGGTFETIGGVTRKCVARLNDDGTLDATFMNGMSGPARNTINGASYAIVHKILPLSDGRLLIGGTFTSVNGVVRGRIARLNSDGSLDATFQNGMAGADGEDAYVSSIAEQADGRLLFAGQFEAMNGVATGPIARLYGTPPVAPAITAHPGNQISHDGSCAVFHVGTSGTPVDYRWRKGGVELTDGATVSGSMSATMTITGVTAGNTGDYDVVIKNVLGGETSTTASLALATLPACQVATCDAVLGSVLAAAPDGSACSDGNVCTAVDLCSSGACAPGAPVPPPGETADVRIDGHGPSVLSWADAGGGAVYDVASSTVADLRATGTTGATCLADDVPTAGYSDTQPNPAAGTGYYYLIRAQSACGNGTYGTDSAEAPRLPAAACP